jgi:outer membrane protein OmpA-like peptidoglycan-associated protein
VLLNGRRVELEAIHATGEMALGSAKRPFETVILNHPRYPVSLRIAYGPRDAGFPFTPDFVREVVRIDLPTLISGQRAGGPGVGAGTGNSAIADALSKECRVELSGIYFDFNQATLKPQSDAALREIAQALRNAQRRLTLEGHTDNIGSDQYNNDLSMRRAAAVKTALVRDHNVDAASLTTTGYGERRPVETNDTLAGRARNRRVELACAS